MTPNTFELTITPEAPWRTPLRADIIFGHVCWRLARTLTKSELEDFLARMANRPIFTLSDALPKGMVYRPILPCDNACDRSNDTVEDARALKDYVKKSAFIKEDDLPLYAEASNDTMPHIRNTVLANSVSHGAVFKERYEWKSAISRYTGRVQEGALYAPREYFSTEEKASEEGKTETSPRPLRILAKVFDEGAYEQYGIGNHLRALFREGYGKRKSIGRGVFEVGAWTDETKAYTQEGASLLLLSSFAPRTTDPTNGMYQLRVKYGKLGEERAVEGNHHKKPLVMVSPGSTFAKPDGYQGYVGRMVDGLSKQYSDVLDYGYGFTVEF